MKHFAIMALFGAMVSVVFGIIGRESKGERLKYGLKVFAEFIGIGLILAWVLYFFPL